MSLPKTLPGHEWPGRTVHVRIERYGRSSPCRAASPSSERTRPCRAQNRARRYGLTSETAT